MSDTKNLTIQVKGDQVRVIENPENPAQAVVYRFTDPQPTLASIVARYMEITRGGVKA